MLTERTRQNTVAEFATAKPGSALQKTALPAGNSRRPVSDFATADVGVNIGQGWKTRAIRNARPDTTHGNAQSLMRLAASASGAASLIPAASTLTTSTRKRSCAPNIANILQVSVSSYGSVKWAISKCFALTAIASKLGEIVRNDIAVERITNAQRQERMFA